MSHPEFGNEARAGAAGRAAPLPPPGPAGPPGGQGGGDPLADIVEILETLMPALPPEKQSVVSQALELLKQASGAPPPAGIPTPGPANALPLGQ